MNIQDYINEEMKMLDRGIVATPTSNKLLFNPYFGT